MLVRSDDRECSAELSFLRVSAPAFAQSLCCLRLSLVLGAQVAPLVDGSQAVTLPVVVMLYQCDNFQSYMSVAARDFLKPRKKAEMA